MVKVRMIKGEEGGKEEDLLEGNLDTVLDTLLDGERLTLESLLCRMKKRTV